MEKIIPILSSVKSFSGAWFVSLLAIFAPLNPILYSVLFLIFADNITGIISYYYKHNVEFHFWKRSSWKHIKSHKLGHTLNKTLAYMLLIIASFVVDTFVIKNEGEIFTKIIAGAVVFRELLSILENTEEISGINLIKIIKAFLNKGFREGASDILDDKEKNK